VNIREEEVPVLILRLSLVLALAGAGAPAMAATVRAGTRPKVVERFEVEKVRPGHPVGFAFANRRGTLLEPGAPEVCLAGQAMRGAARPWATGAEEAASCAAVCRRHPGRVKRLFAALDLGRKGLEKVKAAVEGKEWPKACAELVAYYRHGETAGWLRVKTPRRRRPAVLGPWAGRVLKRAGEVLEDTFTFQAVTARQPRRKGGGLDWAHNGPHGDAEWGYFLNRHPYFPLLLQAWRVTGESRYPRHFDALVRDWVESNPPPDARVHNVRWRNLEAGLRLRDPWPRAFYGFQEAKEFSPAARILMLSSVHEHAEYVLRFHAGGMNHLLMEMYGLANAAACWPEFRDSKKWFKHAVTQMTPAMARQVYRDGAQKELTSHYHQVCIANFEPFADLAARLGHKMPESYRAALESMWSYVAGTLRPDGAGLLNNDSDRNDNRRELLRAAGRYKRRDWAYIATNGREGRKPGGLPSRVFPWAGQAVMRSGWDGDAHWSFFDVGPAGIAHRHRDRLHLSVSAFGRDLLVDGGRYHYRRDAWRTYFVTAPAHNVVLLDGCGQEMGRTEVRKPMRGNYALLPAFDYVRGKVDQGFTDLKGRAEHTRAVVYLRGKYWLVFDRVTSDRPRKLEALWHFHPGCSVKAEGLQAVSSDAGKGNLRIVPAAGPRWQLKTIKGRRKPSIQGWYSPTYNVKQPSSTAVYSAGAAGNATFAWVLFPAAGKVPEIKVEALPAPAGALRVRVTSPGEKPVEVALRFEGARPVPLCGDLTLEGDCAIVGLGAGPLVAGGRVLGPRGRALASHSYGE